MNGRADECESVAGDSDGDGIIDLIDNCPLAQNPPKPTRMAMAWATHAMPAPAHHRASRSTPPAALGWT